MKYLRLFVGDDGESHIGEIEAQFSLVDYAPPAPALELADPVPASRHIMVRFPAGWDSGLHPSPQRQLFVVLSGQIEGAASDGFVMRLGPGDVLLMEDTSGKGHTARVVGDEGASALFVHLE
ncbi:MAG: cupin domain-containing protein [Rhodobacter sp.]|nr:cupin domain-containing protein [Rhodobacter sp.]